MRAITGEPTAQEAAALVQQLMGAGTVGRLDLVHAALREAYLRGRSDVRGEAQEMCRRAAQRFADDAQRLASKHADQFVADVGDQAAKEADWSALPWPERLPERLAAV